MFTTRHRDEVRQFVLEMAQSDPRVTAGALIGSLAAGAEDRWSDIDMTFGIAADHTIETVMADWTQVLEGAFDVLTHFDLHSGSSLYRVFLLPDGLEIDVSVTPEAEFGARGPHFHLLFGRALPYQTPPPPETEQLIGLCWHHVFHAHSCIERGKPWQAAYWISELRHHTLALACIRLGENAAHGRGMDTLPAAVTDRFTETLICSLDEPELRRALAAATRCLITELEQHDATLCARLRPLLQEVGFSQIKGE